jgi:hypothetical protein
MKPKTSLENIRIRAVMPRNEFLACEMENNKKEHILVLLNGFEREIRREILADQKAKYREWLKNMCKWNGTLLKEFEELM